MTLRAGMVSEGKLQEGPCPHLWGYCALSVTQAVALLYQEGLVSPGKGQARLYSRSPAGMSVLPGPGGDQPHGWHECKPCQGGDTDSPPKPSQMCYFFISTKIWGMYVRIDSSKEGKARPWIRES